MKRVLWSLLVVLTAVTPVLTHAQVSAYGVVSVSKFTNLVTTDYLSGGTIGILVDGPEALHRFKFSGDIQGRFLTGNEQFSSLSVGPRVTMRLGSSGKGKIAPYAEFLVGFGRFGGNAANNKSTDSLIQINGGVSRKISSHWDAVADYSYSQYYAYGGQYNPKTFSLGAMYHFRSR